MENKKKLRVIVWDCEKGEVVQDFMTNSIICGYDAEEDGHRFFKTFFGGKDYGKRAKIADLKYMRKSCKKIISFIRKETEENE